MAGIAQHYSSHLSSVVVYGVGICSGQHVALIIPVFYQNGATVEQCVRSCTTYQSAGGLHDGHASGEKFICAIFEVSRIRVLAHASLVYGLN